MLLFDELNSYDIMLPDISNYKIIKEIGKGGSGTVYLAQNKRKEFVALKVLQYEKMVSKEKEAIATYIKTLKKIQHPNIVPINEVYDTKGLFYYEMPIADGISKSDCTAADWKPMTLEYLIRERAKSGTWFTVNKILNIFLPIISAVSAIWEQKLMHRDIKPDNILFINGKACLGDMGLL